jgi:hypothetical protein
MRLLLAFLVLASFNLYAKHDVCLTQGDCRYSDTPSDSTKCFVIKTGQDNQGGITCALRCYTVVLGNTCFVPEGRASGFCEKEKTPLMPIFDLMDPNRCDSAVDPIEFD